MIDLSIAKKEMEHTAHVLLEKFSAIRDAKPTSKIFFNLKIKHSNGVTPLSYIADVQQNQSTFIIKLFNNCSIYIFRLLFLIYLAKTFFHAY